ncbi:rhamnan synthesis F family protein [Hyphobacterium sp. HN65]|uniref:Rhamnan synthesis F family protein n=1 Tax=Hyphobacterium lacteum TaxID=3116575 RepID=A0ABU7LNR7_9PROT|nr:rhamnan synthesis F family protein [Hyphobacterium sp. HN65]MEE2525559.1 rhamnan synthesis F family protein [Hyphobacterium sp. HN65]
MSWRRYVRWIKWPWRWVFDQRERKDYIAQFTSWTIATLIGPRSMVRQTWDGKDNLASARDVAILVTWDMKGRVHDFLIEHMKALKKAGRTVILVSNSPEFPEDEVAKALPHCGLVAWRHNRGYDFGAYRDGVLLVPDYDRLDSLILINDSIYGPFQPLAPLLKKAKAEKADVWGMTDSWDTRWHLQSYFLFFHAAALRNKWVKALWQNWTHVQSKSWIINKLEIGLTGRIEQQGLKCAALFPYRSQVTAFANTVRDNEMLADESLPEPHRRLLERMLELADAGAPMNPCHFFWDQLIVQGFPFMKREVLTANPIGMPRLYEWSDVVGNNSKYDPDLVVRHLRAIAKNRVV